MFHRKKWSILFLSIFGLAALAPTLMGQGTQGSIAGRVTDPSGSVIPSVAVTLTNAGTDQQRKTTTNADGYYTFSNLFPGTYSIEAESKGFKTWITTGVNLPVAQAVTEDIRMQVGSTTTNIQVKASAPLLQPESGSTGQVITNRQIMDLPLNGRNFLDLALLSAGASENPGAQSQFSINGQRGNETSMLFDGADVRLVQNGRPAFVPSVDALQEFNIQQNSFSAEYGYGTAIINGAFRSGTNQFHGDVWEFLRNDALDSRSYFDSSVPPLKRNQYGFTVGGPIRKNKTFFFVDFEGLRTRQSGTGFALVPTTDELKGNFTGDPPIYDPLNVDPTTGQRVQFKNNIIPTIRISQFGQAALKLYPAPNLVGVKGSNYTKRLNNLENADQTNVKIDQQLTSKDSFFLRGSRSRDLAVTDSALPYAGSIDSQNALQVVLHETHIFSPSLLSDFVAAYTYGLSVESIPLAATPIASADFGLKNLTIPGFDQGAPQLKLVGYSTIGTSPFRPVGGKQNEYQLTENLTYIKGKNQFHFGGEARQSRPALYGQATPNSILSFDGRFTNQLGVSGTGSPIADLVLGYPYSARVTQAALGNTEVTLRWTRWVLYGQDDIRITPKLTLNAGLRFMHQSSPSELFNNAYVWSTTQNMFLIPGQTIDNLMNATNNYAPRLGLAYRVTPRTVFRAGVGTFYGFIRGEELASGYNLDPPFTVDSTLNSDPLVPTLPGVLFPLPPTTIVPTPNNNIFSVDHNFYPNYTYEWNANVQRQLASNLMLEISYVGSSSHGLTGRDLVNQAHVDVNPSMPTPVQSRRPFQGAADISITKSIDHANYNALQVTLDKHYSNGLSLLAAYTHGRALGISEGGDQSAIGDEYSPRHRYYGPLPYDQKERFTFAYTYELPVGHGKAFLGSMGGPVSKLISGWQTTGIGTFFTGEAVTPSSSTSADVGRADRNPPNCLGNGMLSGSQQTLTNFYNASAFVSQPFGTFGNCGTGILRRPNFNDFDLGLLKDTTFHERYRFEFRAEFFNTFNHPNFGTPGLTVGSKSFGVIRSTRGNAREIQFGVKLYF